ncbi:hypothetical protein EII38_04540 [Streptococcus minor]|uniref:Uncharacterized protein n=1 Tax=Streptococcus minor TaxID=229549 RepID=A0A3P1VCJ4_9STRE|nr:hypothetical protein [Streptococcus minor]RRD31498.1 hypothetical protein EII38_04540 [Streptococcus minor]
MEIRKDVSSVDDLHTWSGGRQTLQSVKESGLGDELMALLDEMFPSGAEEVQINDFLWFERDFVYRSLGMTDYLDDESEDC